VKVAVVLIAALAFWVALFLIVYVVVNTIKQIRRHRWVRRNTEPMELGPDPMDPHGDGTLRPGDPMFELIMSTNGAPISASRDASNPNVWNVTRHKPTGVTIPPEQLRALLEGGGFGDRGSC